MITYVCLKICMWMFIAALFITAKIKARKCPSDFPGGAVVKNPPVE